MPVNTYLARVTECVHGYVSCTFGDCPGGTTTRIDKDELIESLYAWNPRAGIDQAEAWLTQVFEEAI
jgi:hypothetical protein